MDVSLKTTYECCTEGKDVNRTLSVIHYANSSSEALLWLENNGGGVYRNTLHNYQFHVKPEEIRTPQELKK